MTTETTTSFYMLEKPLVLHSGAAFGPVTLAYETYGTLSEKRDNAILLFHALSGSQHAAGFNPSVEGLSNRWTDECQTGWWDGFIGPGRALDTDRYFIICANYLGGCYGTTGPQSIDPQTNQPYGSRFPCITASDIVNSQLQLLDHLGIETLHATIGASLGGMLALDLAVRHPERVRLVVPIATGPTVSTLQRIMNFEQICAIEEDPNFKRGDYYDGPRPDRGLALARMISHKTYVSLSTLANRASGEIVARDEHFGRYDLCHPVESYMWHQAQKFVHRFDANTYLRLMCAWQHYDLLQTAGQPTLADVFKNSTHQRYLVFSIDTDVCFYPEQQSELAQAIQAAGTACQHITVHSEKGHDAFLLEPDLFTPHLVFTLQEKW